MKCFWTCKTAAPGTLLTCIMGFKFKSVAGLWKLPSPFLKLVHAPKAQIRLESKQITGDTPFETMQGDQDNQNYGILALAKALLASQGSPINHVKMAGGWLCKASPEMYKIEELFQNPWLLCSVSFTDIFFILALYVIFIFMVVYIC